MPAWNQKLIDVDKFDPWEKQKFLGYGAHMPVMGFLERRNPERKKPGRQSPRGGGDRWGKAWQDGWHSTRGGGDASASSWGGGASWSGNAWWASW